MITLKQLEEVSNKIIDESLSVSLPNRLKDQQLAVMYAFKSRLISKVYEIEAAQPSVRADRTCPECNDSNHKDLLVCGGCETPRRQ